jgi:hypothetical protein
MDFFWLEVLEVVEESSIDYFVCRLISFLLKSEKNQFFFCVCREVFFNIYLYERNMVRFVCY